MNFPFIRNIESPELDGTGFHQWGEEKGRDEGQEEESDVFKHT